MVTSREIDREIQAENRSMVQIVWHEPHESRYRGHTLAVGARCLHSPAGLSGPSQADEGSGTFETIQLDRPESERLRTPIKMIVATLISLVAIGFSLVLPKENAALAVVVAFLGLLSGGLSTSGMREPARHGR